LRNNLLHRLALSALLVAPLAASAAAPTFKPDVTFQGSSLQGWHTLGGANWSAKDGTITGKSSSKDGWLVLDKSFQDVAIYTSFRCSSACSAGYLLRAEKTSDGWKGIFVSLSPNDPADYRVAIDASGKITSKEQLGRAGSQVRLQTPPPPPNPNAPPPRAPRNSMPTVIPPPVANVQPNDWNGAEVIVVLNAVRTFVNQHGEVGGYADASYGNFGPIALYVGDGEVEFKRVMYKDVGWKDYPKEFKSSEFSKQRLSDFYYAWGSAHGDVNHDGVEDVIAGPYYYLGPDYQKRHEIYPGISRNPSDDYTHEDWMSFSGDFTGDGWVDSLTASFSDHDHGVWMYENPRGESRRWDKHLVVADTQREIAQLADIDGDGAPDFV